MFKSEFDSHYQNGEYDAIASYKVDNAIILAAGISSRFAPLSETLPKALLKVKGEIMIERQIRQLYEAGIPKIYIVVGYMKEKFDYLQEKFGVHLIENPDYAVRNNHSSIYAAREYLGNSYICPSDNYYMENIFDPYLYAPYYSAIFIGEKSDKYSIFTNFNGRISRIRKGGSNSWRMMGPAYWDQKFSRQFIDLLESEYDLPGTLNKCWEDIYLQHLDTMTLYCHKYADGIIREFNNLDELCLFDTSYIPYKDSLDSKTTPID